MKTLLYIVLLEKRLKIYSKSYSHHQEQYREITTFWPENVIIAKLYVYFLAPAPSSVMSLTGIKCIDNETIVNPDKWFYQYPAKKSCRKISDFEDKIIAEEQITANQIVFAFQVTKSPKSLGDQILLSKMVSYQNHVN